MQILYERCCGLDIHKNSIKACIITPEGKEIKTFGTMTGDILELVDWIKRKNCTHVAMESTGVYWKPIYNLLETEEIETLVVNAQHIKAVPGRKTDVKDAEWIAELLRHGLLKGSYIPKREQRELRELVRYRKSLINERTREVNRLQKVLEGCNIKLSSVVSNIMGVSGRSMQKVNRELFLLTKKNLIGVILKKPILLEMYEILKEKEIMNGSNIPRNIEEFNKCIK